VAVLPDRQRGRYYAASHVAVRFPVPFRSCMRLSCRALND